MAKCEKCIYKKNCHFLSTHKKTIVEDCSCFEDENKVKAEAVKEFAERLKKKAEGCFYDLANLDDFMCAVTDIDNLVKEFTEGKADE